MGLLCETREPIPASVSWASPGNTSFTKAIWDALLRKTLASLKSSVVGVLCILPLTAGDCHLSFIEKMGMAGSRISDAR